VAASGVRPFRVAALKRTLLPRGVRVAQGTGQCNGAGIIEVMSNARSRRFPVTITQLPVTRCQICHRTIAYRPGNLSQVLTEHYRRAHPEALGVPSPQGSRRPANALMQPRASVG
jgi:hypothetical protein